MIPEPTPTPSYSADQTPPAGQATTPGPDPVHSVAPTPAGPRAVRTGTIVWGAIVLVACAFVAQQVLAPGTLDATAWVTALVLGLGVLLLVAGIAAVVKQSRRGR